ncbi:hypothetical protein FDE29_09775 [Vibrio parahaemolyticus]|nr:hypothetical protein [Vibrio parahaemolyticus]EGQ9889231.1 hypothetical protein [Vibrio parahaemolyticus]EGR0438643.1 hypothetical protein [Vibrio parahaemolyticus]EGR0766941.1 hypothetical protein [Vibrio parahaemolyticus]EGR0998192.1 hypothetical protein [Vibrio parahaemolyticus]
MLKKLNGVKKWQQTFKKIPFSLQDGNSTWLCCVIRSENQTACN